MSDPEIVARRDRGLRRRACSASSASTPTRCRQPRAHPAVQPDRRRVDRRAQRSTCPRWSARCSSRRSASSACSSSTSSSRPPTARRSPCGSTACWPRRRSRRGSTGTPLDIGAMLRTPDGKPALRDRHHRPPRPTRSASSSRRCVLSKLVTWMRRQSGTTDLRALLYMDEVAGYLPPTADAADEEADHDADEAGPGLRRRRRAGHAEPGRRRLQGDLQRRHVDDRPAADRAGQGTACSTA